MIKFFHCLVFTIVLSSTVAAQIAVSGPMQGYTTDSSANIWLMVKQNQLPLHFTMNDSTAKIEIDYLCHKKWCSYNLNISEIAVNESQLTLSNGETQEIFSLHSTIQDNQDSFSFLLGSCTFRWGPLLPFMPSNGYKIFNAMAKEETDLMLWLGDNVYYLLGDHKNEARMFMENVKSRKKKAIATFFQNKQHFAIWDDHDFGANNSNGTYKKKDISKKIFDHFWANPNSDSEGIYYSFNYGNAEFFMLDGRWFSTDPEEQPNQLLGKEQLAWLTEGLKNSKATFKLVALGSQMINPLGLHHERFAAFSEEYNSLLATAASLENVIFLSGDMHYSTVFKNEDFGKPLYEFSCSPLSSMRYKIRKRNEEFQNPYQVEGTQYHHQNFGKVTIDGEQCTFEVFDRKGKLVWTYVVP